MKKQRKPLSTKKPPVPSEDHGIIEDWINSHTMPDMQPLVRHVDQLIIEKFPDLRYAIKWGNAFYGLEENGWVIEVGAFAVSVNIVFLNGAAFNPQPPLGTDAQTRYVKIRSIDDIEDQKIIHYIEQAQDFDGWK